MLFLIICQGVRFRFRFSSRLVSSSLPGKEQEKRNDLRSGHQYAEGAAELRGGRRWRDCLAARRQQGTGRVYFAWPISARCCTGRGECEAATAAPAVFVLCRRLRLAARAGHNARAKHHRGGRAGGAPRAGQNECGARPRTSVHRALATPVLGLTKICELMARGARDKPLGKNEWIFA